MFVRAAAVVAVLIVMVLLFAPEGMGQPGPKDYKKKKGDGGGDGGNQWGKGGDRKKGGPPGGGATGGMGMDANTIFQFASKGTGFVDIATARDKEGMEKFANEKGITGGKLNQQQFADYWDQRTKNGGGFGKLGGPPTEKKSAEKSRSDLEKLAEEEFKKRDSNGDGKLNYDEMDAQLRREMVHYDKNEDQLIDLQEYTAYFIDRYQQAERDKSQASTTPGVQVYEDDLDVRPVVYRYGKLPATLPEWFTRYDSNQDGLVSLAEWLKSSGKNPEEFAAMDRDGDGLLTPEEVLRFNNGGAAPTEEYAGGTGGSNPGFGNRGAGAGGGGKGGLGLLGLFGGGRGKGGQGQGGQQAQVGQGGGGQQFVPGGGGRQGGKKGGGKGGFGGFGQKSD